MSTKTQRGPNGEPVTYEVDDGIADETYTCAACGETFPKGWSDEEANAERERDFPGLPDEHAVVVCDDCYRQMQAEFATGDIPWAWVDNERINDAIRTVEDRSR